MLSFGVFLGQYGIDDITAKRIAAILNPAPSPELTKQETF